MPVRHLGIVHSGNPDHILTVSVGVAVLWPRHGDQTAHDLVQQADAALYRAKKDGRDRVHLEPARPNPGDCEASPATPAHPDQQAA